MRRLIIAGAAWVFATSSQAAVWSSETADGIYPAFAELNQVVTQRTTKVANRLAQIFNTTVTELYQAQRERNDHLEDLNGLDQYDTMTVEEWLFEVAREKKLKSTGIDMVGEIAK